MQHTQGYFQGFAGLQLYRQAWLPDQTARAAIAIVHGFGDHSGCLMNFVNHLVPQGYAISSFDLRGHGRSAGARGHIMQWEEYRQDLDTFLRSVVAEQPGLPLFLLGHSLGGLIVLDYILHDPVKVQGIIVSAPLLGKPGVAPILLSISKILSRVAPAFSLKLDDGAATISRDPAQVKAYVEDPLVHSTASMRFGTEMSAAQDWVHTHAADLRLPLFVYQGTADRVVDPGGVLQFFRHVPDGDKQYIAYEGAYHNVHMDLGREEAFGDISDWLKRHLGPAQPA